MCRETRRYVKGGEIPPFALRGLQRKRKPSVEHDRCSDRDAYASDEVIGNRFVVGTQPFGLCSPGHVCFPLATGSKGRAPRRNKARLVGMHRIWGVEKNDRGKQFFSPAATFEHPISHCTPGCLRGMWASL